MSNKNKIWIRTLALILGGLMAISTMATAFYFVISSLI